MEHQDISTRLGFIDTVVFPDSSIRGALLVTDLETKPYEFRVTSPIKPTQLQQILYGRTLSEFVVAELICVPLLKACKEKINFVIIKQIQLLNMRPYIEFPVICVSRKDDKNNSNELMYHAHKNFVSELEAAKLIISAMAEKVDIFEPFQRIKTAINEVHRQKLDEKK